MKAWAETKKATPVKGRFGVEAYRVGVQRADATECEGRVGSGVLSHAVTRAVPSALVSLTAGFGMEPGGPSRL